MLGLSPGVLIAGAAGYALAAALGWAALHEYGVASKQAAHDRAGVAVATAGAEKKGRAMQHAADLKQIKALRALAAAAEAAYTTQQQIATRGARKLASANLSLATLTARAPATACIRQPIPPQVARAALWLH